MGRVKCPVRESGRRFPDRPALEFEGARWTWGQLDAAVGGWQRWLEAHGVRQADRVATLAWSRPELLLLWFALGRLGAALVPLNARLTAAELGPLVERAGVRLVLADEALIDRLPGARPFPAPAPQAVADGEPEGSQVFAALFTSGTTGTPTLVPLTVGNFVAAHAANAANLGAVETQVWLGTLPLFHVGGLAMAFRWAMMGAALVLERQFDAGRAAALLRRGDLTHASVVPTALARLLDQPGPPFASSLAAILVGGGPMGAELLSRARARGLPVLQTYGLTEACSQVTTERPAEADGSTAGHALPGLEVRVVDEHGVSCAPGTVGEVQVRGGTVTPIAGEWLPTKDLGSLDARGRLTVHARRVDLIVSGGENIYPAEVEAVLSASGLVTDVAVAPMADPTWGQVPVAFVVWKAAAADEALLTYARARLAGFKVPRRLVAMQELPRNAGGKLLRHQLVAPHSPA
ncbi:MAG: AMP-binding protein [Myxococcaceae bacterium]|nr:AMP-binding protein [Myxococcaceae bacterium]